ncbi:MAG: hypothetical protein ITG02_04075 [Patulibacter sp.]|nr:hypothetical protein [Patulibacter sp.]
MRVLVWNLFHGRAQPPAGRPLLHEFADALASWEWDVALLQEVPPWWPPLLARRCGADWRSARTSRNALLPLRRVIASRRPDWLKSNGGGANAILVRAPWTIAAHGRRRLRIRPERRVMHAVRLIDPGGGPFDGAWVGNVHSQLGNWDDDAGMAAPLADLSESVASLETWAVRDPRAEPGKIGRRPVRGPVGADDRRRTGMPGDRPLVLGGDLNLPRTAVATNLPPAWARIATSGPDHVVGRGIVAAAPSSRPERGRLSDHAPLLVDVVVRP